MRLLVPLLLAGCAGQPMIPDAPADSDAAEPGVPPIDLRVPEHLETATFALG